jgi:hypothetical protein
MDPIAHIVGKIFCILTEPVQLVMFLWIILREVQGYLLLEKLKDATIAQTNVLIKTDSTIDAIMQHIIGGGHR